MLTGRDRQTIGAKTTTNKRKNTPVTSSRRRGRRGEESLPHLAPRHALPVLQHDRHPSCAADLAAGPGLSGLGWDFRFAPDRQASLPPCVRQGERQFPRCGLFFQASFRFDGNSAEPAVWCGPVATAGPDFAPRFAQNPQLDELPTGVVGIKVYESDGATSAFLPARLEV